MKAEKATFAEGVKVMKPEVVQMSSGKMGKNLCSVLCLK
jgi:hypothetical protein